MENNIEVVEQIVDRRNAFQIRWTGEPLQRFDKVAIKLDLLMAHNRSPLKLEELLEANELDFIHDVDGIRRHIDPNTGEMRNCFLPRYAVIGE